MSISHPSPRIRAVYSTRRDRQRDGAGARSFELAKALIRGLKPLPQLSPIQGRVGELPTVTISGSGQST